MLKRANILVVGSLVMDLITNTNVFPSEGESVFGTHFSTAPGGKGANQAVQIARLGANVKMVGCVGEDDFGKRLISAAKESGVNVSDIMITGHHPSAIGNIILEKLPSGSTQNRIIIIPGANMSIKPADVAFLEKEIRNYDMVVLQYEIPMEVNKLIAEYAVRAKVPVMFNCAPYGKCDDDFLRNITYICVNEHEAAQLSGVKINNDDTINLEDVKRAADNILKRGASKAIITLGKGGAAYCEKDVFIHVPVVENITAVDPTAAGDSFTGGFVAAVCNGFSNKDALLFSSYVAAKTVSKIGAMPSLPYLKEVAALVRLENKVNLNFSSWREYNE